MAAFIFPVTCSVKGFGLRHTIKGLPQGVGSGGVGGGDRYLRAEG